MSVRIGANITSGTRTDFLVALPSIENTLTWGLAAATVAFYHIPQTQLSHKPTKTRKKKKNVTNIKKKNKEKRNVFVLVSLYVVLLF